MSTPDLYLQTAFMRDRRGRIICTREPNATPGPLFTLVRSATACSWAVRADLAPEMADKLNSLAQKEPPVADLQAAPLYADSYRALAAAHPRAGNRATESLRSSAGVAFTFPEEVAQPTDITIIEDERRLAALFTGWIPGEIAAGRAPVLATVVDGAPVSLCFCARRSDAAAEAGLETAGPYRGRGLAARVAAAWAWTIRKSGRTPLYSTAWHNTASLSVARKLALVAYASTWSLVDN